MRRKVKLNKKELISKSIILLIIGVALALSCIFYSAPIEAALGIGKTDKSGNYVGVEVVTQNDFVVHYIDVKQADCTFIELPDGKTMLIDAGDLETADDVVEYVQAVIEESKTIDYFVLTHSDSDHVGGAPAVFEAFDVLNIYRPFALAGKYTVDGSQAQQYFDCNDAEDLETIYNTMKNDESLASYASKIPRVKTNIYNQVVEAIYSEKYNNDTSYATVTVNYDGLCINSSDAENPYEIEFYAPLLIDPQIELDGIAQMRTKGFVTKGYGAYSATGYNSISPVIRIEYMGNKFLFTGDIYENAEAEVVDSFLSEDYEELANITVYQAGHHGASNSNTEEFLNIITPTYTVVSSNNDGNDYGHPTPEFLDRIAALPHDITDYLLRTDMQGNIVFGVSSTGDISYAANVELTNTVFEVEWWHIAVGIFVVVAVLLFNIKVPQKSKNN